MKLTDEKVYRLLRTVPRGRVTTYKALARAFGSKAYRYVGTVMKNNPDAPRTPCHRVVSSSGTIGGFMGHAKGETIRRKEALLRQEGIRIKNHKILDFETVCIASFRK